jgi:hypothetical protein
MLVRLKVETTGGDEFDNEQTFPVGAQGIISAIDECGITVVIENTIVNVFDETDGDCFEAIHTKTVTMSVTEQVTYHVPIMIPVCADPAEYIDEHGEEIWGNASQHVHKVEELRSFGWKK